MKSKPTIGFGPVSGFKLDGEQINPEEARRHWHDQSADWTQGAFEAMVKIILAEKPAKERKTSKGLLTEKVDAFLWFVDNVTGGTPMETARQVESTIPRMEEKAAEIARLYANAGKLVLADSHLCRYASEVIPAKLEAYKARLPEALRMLAEDSAGDYRNRAKGEMPQEAPANPPAPIVDTKEALTLESPPASNLVAFPGGFVPPSNPLRAFLERVAGLNPKAGEIGAGMLAQLIDEAQRLLDEKP